MNDSDKIFLLERELEHAGATISFLHGCLTDPQFEYAYPERTQEQLDRIHELVPEEDWCIHSVMTEGCESCQRGHKYRVRLAEIKARQEES